MQSPKPPSQPFPHDEIKALDARNVERLLAINVEFQSFFKKHPFFETDPVCRLARQLCIGAHRGLPSEAERDADRLCVNGGYEISSGPIPIAVNLGPKKDPNEAIPQTFPDFLLSGNRPRPLWMAWIPQARAAIEAQKKIEAADA